MKKVLLIAFQILIAVWCVAQERREQGNLVIEGIPEISPSIIERLDQYQNVRSATFSDWDPSGNEMLIATRFADTNQIHHLSGPGMYRRQITFFREPVSTGVFAPKNKDGFIFEMDEGGGEFDQLYWFDLKKGKWNLLTDGGKSVNRSVLFSNSKSIAAYSSTKRNGTDFDLYILDPQQPESARLVKEVKGLWAALDWSDDDSKLLIAHYISVNESEIYEMDIASGELTVINPSPDNKISYKAALYSRDRGGVYYLSDEDSEFSRLWHYDLKTKKKQPLVNKDWDVELLDVSLDGKHIAFSANEGGISTLYLGDAKDPASASKVDLPAGVISKLKFDRQSKRLALNLSSAGSPSDVYSVDVASRKVERWTFSETGGLDSSIFVDPSLIEFPTFDQVDGKQRMIPAFYYKPRNEAAQHPVIISIHGGPESQSRASFNSMIQYWVNELGIAVLVPNVRGSSGYGKSYLQLDNGIKREDSVKDIGALLDWISKQPDLDSKRVAVYGGSYGGFMVLSTLSHYSDRIRCAIDVVGISNFVTFLESTESYRRDLRRAEYGDERDPKMREFLNAISPLTNANRIKSPLFVIQGKNDPRVPVTEAEQVVKSVRAQGKTVWYLMAKDEGHGFAKKSNRDYQLAAMTLFLQQFLLN